MGDRPNVCVVILNWNNYADTKECLTSLLAVDYPQYSIVVVDNGSRHEDYARLKEAYGGHEKIRLIRNDENLGFTGGNNVGMRLALERQADYILLLNNDTIVDKGLLSALILPFQHDEKLGMTTPKIYFYHERNRIWAAGGDVDAQAGRITMRGRGEWDKGQYDTPYACSFVTGCALMIKRSVLETVGLLDETFFHSAEDVDLSLRVRKAGYTLHYIPSSHVWHKVMASTGGRGVMSPLGAYYAYRNKLYVLSRYGGLHSLRAKATITREYAMAFLSLFIKKKAYRVSYGVFLGVRDFFLGIEGKARVKTEQRLTRHIKKHSPFVENIWEKK